jgi:hypothetical protein
MQLEHVESFELLQVTPEVQPSTGVHSAAREKKKFRNPAKFFFSDNREARDVEGQEEEEGKIRQKEREGAGEKKGEKGEERKRKGGVGEDLPKHLSGEVEPPGTRK